ncbi:MAG: tetratricopeptide repeat protein [Spirochaetales bacterium]|nr:tetratricopeptide repeat protein [Spirochaetales bacterium]
MFGLFKAKTRKPGIDEAVSEKWDTRFKRSDEQRFETMVEPGYSAATSSKGYCLAIQKRHCFAWGDNPWYRYYDFFMEAEIVFDKANGHSAAGFLFRKIADEHYYYFLVSTNGYFRFDLVRNDEPQVLIGWTPCPEPVDHTVFLRIIARGDEFVFMVNEEWVASFSDETIDGGRIAFGGQNYGEEPRARFYLKQFRVNSLPMDVETAFDRWSSVVHPHPDARIRLAETLSSQGMWAPAAVHLKKAFSRRSPSAEELFLLGECYLNLELFPEASDAFDQALQKKPDYKEARLEKGNVLYLSNRFLELRDYMSGLAAVIQDRSVCYNLLGHGEFGLGNWEQAADAYRKAYDLDQNMPLYLIHQGRALERMERNSEALGVYLKAADLLFKQEAYMDLDGLLPVIDALDNGNAAVHAVHGKVAFHREEYAGARKIFGDIIAEGSSDSTVYFLYGLCLIIEGSRDIATEYLFKAVELEPDYYLYWFRLAENLYLLDLDAAEEIREALSRAPEDPWVLNLAGLIALHEHDVPRAAELLEAAHGLLPGEEDININLSQVRALLGNFAGAREVLDGFEMTAAIYNQHGNVCIEQGRLEEALEMYDKALSLEPDNSDFLLNSASVCLELDMVIRAEELLGRIMESNPGPPVYLKLAQTAIRKGEYYRAEVVLEQGVEAFGDHPGLWKDYLKILFLRNQLRKADKVLARLMETREGKEEFDELCTYILKRYYRTYSCCSCNREWHVPLKIGPRGGLDFLGQPGDELPAGKCSECGKVYCIRCARKAMEGNKFQCPECGVPLKLSEDWIEYLLTKDSE